MSLSSHEWTSTLYKLHGREGPKQHAMAWFTWITTDNEIILSKPQSVIAFKKRTQQLQRNKYVLGPASLRLMTSQFKDIVTHTQKYKTVECIFCGVWVQKFYVKFQRCPLKFYTKFWIHTPQICILRGVRNLTTYDILELWHLKS